MPEDKTTLTTEGEKQKKAKIEVAREIIDEKEDTNILGYPQINDLQSATIDEVSEALAKVQSEMESAKKDQTNPYFKSKYADLTEVIGVSRPLLVKHGIAVVQQTTITPKGTVLLVTTAIHKSGQYIRGFYPVVSTTRTPQGYGSALTYARRYAYAALVGVTQEDDDAEKATIRSY